MRAAAKSTVSTHDLSNLRASLLAAPFNGAIPHEVRGTIWLLLLRLRAEDLLAEDANRFAQTARHAVGADNSREQIEKDVERTRPGLARFKQPAVRGALLRLLSLFCERHKVSYVQGLNELLAPFILLADTGSNPRIAYALFSAFVARFAPWTLEASETRMFEVLKRLFKYFERLLLYHDPELYWLLNRYTMTPDLYATSWFITLFSRNFTVESVLALWDLILLEDNPLGTSFFAVALLRSKRNELLTIDESRIPETLMSLTAVSPEEVRHLWKIGSEMRVDYTPPSFQRLMTDRIINDAGTPVRTAISAARSMQDSVCLQTTPDDLIAGDAQYFTWDCRTKAEYEAGHLAQAAHLPLEHVRGMNGIIGQDMSKEARAELQNASDMCEQLRGSTHVCLIGSGVREEDKTDVNVLAMYLTRLGIPYISTLRGGFEDALTAMKKDESLTSVELVDYDRRKHIHARKARSAAQKKRETEVAKNPRRSGGGIDNLHLSSNMSPRTARSEAMDEVSHQAEEGNGFSAFLEKTDAEVSKALAKALSGIGFKYSLSSASTSVDRDESWSNQSTPRFSGAPAASLTSSIDLTSRTGSEVTSGTNTPRRAISVGLRRVDSNSKEDINNMRKGKSSSNMSIPSLTRSGDENGCEDGQFTNQHTSSQSPRYNTSLSAGAPSSTSEHTSEQKNNKRNASNTTKSSRSPWVQDAKPGWLNEDTLKFPLSAMPKGFTVNILDEQIMSGLQLFPCKARAERMTLRGRTSEFKRRFVGVSKNYFLLLGPYHNRNHLLEVKIIRYLQDIIRITFKRSRPELVTFSILTTQSESGPTENVICIMPDGLKECVDLIRGYIAEETSGNDEEGVTGTVKKSDSEKASNETRNISGPLVNAKHRSESLPAEVGRIASLPRSRSDGNERKFTMPVLRSSKSGFSSNTVDEITGRVGTRPLVSVESGGYDEQDEFGDFQSVAAAMKNPACNNG